MRHDDPAQKAAQRLLNKVKGNKRSRLTADECALAQQSQLPYAVYEKLATLAQVQERQLSPAQLVAHQFYQKAAALLHQHMPEKKPKVFGSYAWEEGDKLEILRYRLLKLSLELNAFGVSFISDCTDLIANIDKFMIEEVANCDYFLLIGTPKLKARLEEKGSNNVKFELLCAMDKLAQKPNSLLLLRFEGDSHTDAYPQSLSHILSRDFTHDSDGWGNLEELKKFKTHLNALTSLYYPIGLIPVLFGITQAGDLRTEYEKLQGKLIADIDGLIKEYTVRLDTIQHNPLGLSPTHCRSPIFNSHDYPNDKLAEGHIRLAQEKALATDANAQYLAGVGSKKKGDLVNAYEYFHLASQQGHIDATYCLAMLYFKGKGICEEQMAASKIMALPLLARAATAGHINSQLQLARFYVKNGPDQARAFHWNLQAAEQGNAQGQYNVGRRYWYGEGVKCDKKLAREWLEKSANNGYKDAIQCYPTVQQAVSPHSFFRRLKTPLHRSSTEFSAQQTERHSC